VNKPYHLVQEGDAMTEKMYEIIKERRVKA